MKDFAFSLLCDVEAVRVSEIRPMSIWLVKSCSATCRVEATCLEIACRLALHVFEKTGQDFNQFIGAKPIKKPRENMAGALWGVTQSSMDPAPEKPGWFRLKPLPPHHELFDDDGVWRLRLKKPKEPLTDQAAILEEVVARTEATMGRQQTISEVNERIRMDKENRILRSH